MSRKPIQLHNHDGEMYALCDDGSVWVFTGSMGWMAAGDIPQEDEPFQDAQLASPLMRGE